VNEIATEAIPEIGKKTVLLPVKRIQHKTGVINNSMKERRLALTMDIWLHIKETANMSVMSIKRYIRGFSTVERKSCCSILSIALRWIWAPAS